MNRNTISVNALPSPTWRFLRVNDSVLVLPEELACADLAEWCGQSFPDGIVMRRPDEKLTAAFSAIGTGMGSAADTVMTDAGAAPVALEIAAGLKGETVCLPVTAVCGRALVWPLLIHAGKGSDVSVILDITDTGAGCAAVKGFCGLSVRMIASPEARIHLILTQRLSPSVQYFCDVGADLAEQSRAEMTTLCLGGGDGHLGVKSCLSGAGASFDSEMGYYVRGDAALDVNQIAVHFGKESTSRMDFRGVLEDRAKKTLRGTIDFQTGSADSVGEEQEDTLLLSPEVENRSVPVILCAEESVDGRHGATVGQLSDDMVFYMCSRGYSREQARRLIIQARLRSVAGRIPDGKLRWEVEQWIEREIR